MKTVTLQHAKIHLSKLVDDAAKGKPFIITSGGKPLVKVVALAAPKLPQVRRLGFMTGEIKVPDDFDRMGDVEIGKLFQVAKSK